MTVLEKAMSIPLFRGHSSEEVEKILRCTGAVVSSFEPGEKILSFGDPISRAGIVITGKAETRRTDTMGHSYAVTVADIGELFGLAVALPDTGDGLTVHAGNKGCEALLIDANTILWGCDSYCDSHKKMMFNLLTMMSGEQLNLLNRLRYVSRHNLREKITSYLTDIHQRAGNREFDVPDDRQGMADLLAADRTALSAELSRMKAAGLIDYRKNRFILRDKFFI
jgi:CRP-like cAMP-binding protein